MSDDGRTMTLLEPVLYRDGVHRVTVPAGFETDFNSVPRVFWRFLGPWEFPEAGVVHDYLYRFGIGTRADADHIHRRALINLGCAPLRAWIAWAALRLFGGLPGNWNSKVAR